MIWEDNEDGKLKDLRRALQTWLREGLPAKNGKLYVDPIDEEEYSQMERQEIYDCDCWQITDRLVPAKTDVPFRCCLHKLIVDKINNCSWVTMLCWE